MKEAVNTLHEAAAKGHWVCLKNLHLIIQSLPYLEKEIHSIQEASPKFRLRLTTEEHNSFPSVLLRDSLKITFESPPGVKKIYYVHIVYGHRSLLTEVLCFEHRCSLCWLGSML
eukprot:UN08330